MDIWFFKFTLEETTVYLNFVVSILGVAYPILIQVFAKLDEKYSSTFLVEIFEKEWSRIWFVRFLWISLFSILVWSLSFKPLFHSKLPAIDYLIVHSANLLVIASSISLTVTFFIFINRILIYYVPIRLARYLMERHNAALRSQQQLNLWEKTKNLISSILGL